MVCFLVSPLAVLRLLPRQGHSHPGRARRADKRTARPYKRKSYRVGPNCGPNFSTRIEIFSKIVGPSLAMWANLAQFSFQQCPRKPASTGDIPDLTKSAVFLIGTVQCTGQRSSHLPTEAHLEPPRACMYDAFGLFGATFKERD